MSESEIYAGGLELNFFESASFEAVPDRNSPDFHDIITRNVLRVLMMGWNNDLNKLASWDVYKAIFIQRDYKLTKGMRRAFQQGFNHIFTQLKDQQITPSQHNQIQMYLANCLSLLPFGDITPYEAFSIPQWINNEWKMVDYRVVPIELTPTSGFSKLFLADQDRVFAYGLEAIIDPDAQPHLIFMGTTYPAGQGFITQIDTDLEAFETAGKKLYRSGYNNIVNWLHKQANKVHVCGTSLGGSLSLLLAIDQGEKLSRVDAMNPPGLYSAWHKSYYDKWDNLTSKPEVIVQKQGNDPVSKFGVWKNDWTIVQVTPPVDKQGPNATTDHALNYAGFAQSHFTIINAQEDNDQRKTRNSLLYVYTRSILSYCFMTPFRYLILPAWRYMLANKAEVALIVALAVLALVVHPVIPFVLLVTTAITTVKFLSGFNAMKNTVLGLNKIKKAKCHDPELTRNEELDVYTNEIQATFTCKQIAIYYEAKRCLLKDKSLLAPSNKSHVHFFKSNKFEIIQKGLNSETKDSPVSIKATKAKVIDIQQVNKLYNEPSSLLAFNAQLTEMDSEYRLGKFR